MLEVKVEKCAGIDVGKKFLAALVNKVVSAGTSGLLLEARFKHGVELMESGFKTAIDSGPGTVFQ